MYFFDKIFALLSTEVLDDYTQCSLQPTSVGLMTVKPLLQSLGSLKKKKESVITRCQCNSNVCGCELQSKYGIVGNGKCKVRVYGLTVCTKCVILG